MIRFHGNSRRDRSMGKPYSLDLRERVVAALEGGLSTAQAAARFSVGKATAGARGRLKRPQGGGRPAQAGKPKGPGPDVPKALTPRAPREKPAPALARMGGRLGARARGR